MKIVGIFCVSRDKPQNTQCITTLSQRLQVSEVDLIGEANPPLQSIVGSSLYKSFRPLHYAEDVGSSICTRLHALHYIGECGLSII